MKKIGFFYAPKGGAVNCMAALMVEKLGEKNVDMMCVTEVNADKVLEYDKLIFGNASIYSGSTLADRDKDWKGFLTDLKKINLQGKHVALFGLGNHLTYPKNFVDSLGALADFFVELDAKIVGKVSVEDYVFDASNAARGDVFVGLPLDEDTEGDKSEARIDAWLNQLKKEFK